MSTEEKPADFFDDLADQAKSALDSALDRAASEVAALGAEEKLDELKAAFRREADAVENKLRELQSEAEQWKDEKVQLLRDFEAEKKKQLYSGLAEKVLELIDYLLNLSVVKITEAATSDKWMPKFVKRWIEEVIAALWPALASELKEQVLLKFASAAADDDAENENNNNKSAVDIYGEPPQICWCCCGGGDNYAADGCCPCCVTDGPCGARPCFSFRSWFLYHLFPYDQSIWQVLRSPVWWIFTLLSVVPQYAVAQVMYFFLFLLIDRNDEFQLVNFISAFKSILCIVGILQLAISSVQLFVCVSYKPTASLCVQSSPREQVWAMMAFGSQILLTWAAFLCLLCGDVQQKGGLYSKMRKSEDEDEEMKKKKNSNALAASPTSFLESISSETKNLFEPAAQEEREKARSRLTTLLVYDLFIFFICAGLLVWAALANLLDSDANVTGTEPKFFYDGPWKFVMICYFVKAFYGILQLPFLMLLIPAINLLFTKAAPTAYDPYGNVQPLVGRSDDEDKKKKPWRDVPMGGCCDPDFDTASVADGENNANNNVSNPLSASPIERLSRSAAQAQQQQQRPSASPASGRALDVEARAAPSAPAPAAAAAPNPAQSPVPAFHQPETTTVVVMSPQSAASPPPSYQPQW